MRHDAARHQSHLFTLRMWAEAVGDRVEHRGSVRDVATGAFCNFRQWSDLTAFLAERMDEARSSSNETPWRSAT